MDVGRQDSGLRDALLALGLGRNDVEDTLELAAPEELAAEAAAMCFESDAAIMLDASWSPGEVLAELCDACRRAGAPLELVGDRERAAVRKRAEAYAYYACPDAARRLPGLCGAVSMLLPETINMLLPRPAEDELEGESLPVLVLNDAERSALERAMGAQAFQLAFMEAPPPGAPSPLCPPEPLAEPDAIGAPPSMAPISDETPHEVLARLQEVDPWTPWPVDADRPAGDDFYAYTNALAGAPLKACMRSGDRSALATVFYAWALATELGARWDILASRYYPGTGAQGLLGFGQLIWAYFVFAALGADEEARRTGALLDDEWVRSQERCRLSARQRAYYDLGAYMRTGARGLQLGRIAELAELAEPGAFEDSERVRAGLRVHMQPLGDQYTHHPLYLAWPAPIYALARRAGASSGLGAASARLAMPLDVDDVDDGDAAVTRFRALSEQLAQVEAAGLPPILDPLPVIVEGRVVSVEGEEVVGHTELCGEGGQEHELRGPVSQGQPVPGELWAFCVTGVRPPASVAPGSGRRPAGVPSGRWLEPMDSD